MMIFNPHPPVKNSQVIPRIVIAGDVCVDWLSIPVESLVPESDPTETINWQLRSGRHMYAVPGGVWLTAAFVEAAIEKAAGSDAHVSKPQLEPNLENCLLVAIESPIVYRVADSR
jgi:hypothetical protein